MSESKSTSNNIGGSVTGNFVGESATNSHLETSVNTPTTEPKEEDKKAAELLSQLRVALTNDLTLNEDRKNIALQQVQKLEDALNNPENKTKKQEAKTAQFTLKGILTESLPTAAKLVEECNKILPYIARALGLV